MQKNKVSIDVTMVTFSPIQFSLKLSIPKYYLSKARCIQSALVSDNPPRVGSFDDKIFTWDIFFNKGLSKLESTAFSCLDRASIRGIDIYIEYVLMNIVLVQLTHWGFAYGKSKKSKKILFIVGTL